MFYLDLVHNVALLAALVVIHGIILRRWSRNTPWYQVLTGILFGAVALIGMMTPVNLTPGIIFDGRTIVLSVAGFLGGPITAGVASIISAVYRIWLGGSGTLMGICTILMSGSLGVIFHFLRRSHPEVSRDLGILVFGFLVHLGMVLLMTTLPAEVRMFALKNIAIPVILIYPPATWLICRLLLDQETSLLNEKSLLESEHRYRDLYDNSPDMLFSIDASTGRIVGCNQTACDKTLYAKNELVGKPFFDLYHPDSHEHARKCFEIFNKHGEVHNIELIALKKDGTMMDIMLNSRAVRDDKGAILFSRSSWRDVSDRKMAERALRDSEERYRAIFENAGVGIDLLDREGKIFSANNALSSMLGYTINELERIEFAQLTHPDDIKISGQELRSLMNGEKDSYRIEKRYLKKDGGVLWADLSASMIRDHHGEPVGVVGVIIDITQRKNVEIKLLSSEDRYRSLCEGMNDAVVVFQPTHDGEDFIFVNFNRAGEQIERISRDQVIGRSVLEVFPGVREFGLLEVFQRVLRTGTPEHFPARIYVDDRIQGWRENFVYRLPSGELVSIYSDETDRINSEQALLISEKRTRQLAEVTFEGIMFHDDGILLHANDQFFQMFGYEAHELIHQQVMEKTLHPDSIQTVKSHIISGSTQSYEVVGLKKDGTAFPIEIRVRLLEERGKTIRAVAIRDLSERKNLENLLIKSQKMEAIGTLAGGIAHDFNNLLQVICGYSEILLADMKEDRDRNSVEKILASGKRGSELVKSLLAFSRKVEPQFAPVVLNREIIELHELLSRTIPKNIKIDLHLDKDVPAIMADPSQIGQIIMNVAVNARDAMPDGGTLTIETRVQEIDKTVASKHPEVKPGPYVTLTVTDTGTGIDNKTVGRIFDPFFSTKEVGKGTGLGLATVYGIVKQHKGYITCHSEIGEGTTFRIYFPIAETHGIEDTQTPDLLFQGGQETILLVDDEETVRDLGVAILAPYDYNVITASNGIDALKIYEQRQKEISLVILDISMPEMDGMACLKEILYSHPDAAILIASGYSGEEPEKSALDLGAKGFIQKPYDSKTFIRRIRELLDSPKDVSKAPYL